MFDFPKDVLLLYILVVLIERISGLVGVPLDNIGSAAGRDARTRDHPDVVTFFFEPGHAYSSWLIRHSLTPP